MAKENENGKENDHISVWDIANSAEIKTGGKRGPGMDNAAAEVFIRSLGGQDDIQDTGREGQQGQASSVTDAGVAQGGMEGILKQSGTERTETERVSEPEQTTLMINRRITMKTTKQSTTPTLPEDSQKPSTTTTILRKTPKDWVFSPRRLTEADLRGWDGYGVGEVRSTPLQKNGQQSPMNSNEPSEVLPILDERQNDSIKKVDPTKGDELLRQLLESKLPIAPD
jgi:hypothetical protein